MKHYYRIWDAVLQVLMLAAWLVAFISKLEWVLQLYFITGAWFLISLFVHLRIASQRYKPAYEVYAFIIFGLMILAGLGCFLQILLVLELYFLLVAAPVIALLYTVTCVSEIKHLHKRPISYIK